MPNTTSKTDQMLRRAAIGAALVLSSFACAPGGAAAHRGSAFDAGLESARSSRSVLDQTEITSHGMTGSVSLLDALERLRPEFLRTRRPRPGARRGRLPEVYIESLHAGSIDVLRTIPVSHVQSVQYIRPIDALIRYGMLRNHDAGVILVTLGRP